MSNHYKILAEASDGKLSEEDVYNLETYGALSPMEFAPEPDNGECMCGTKDCPDAYEHTTSGC